jgi:hypothetical protein
MTAPAMPSDHAGQARPCFCLFSAAAVRLESTSIQAKDVGKTSRIKTAAECWARANLLCNCFHTRQPVGGEMSDTWMPLVPLVVGADWGWAVALPMLNEEESHQQNPMR